MMPPIKELYDRLKGSKSSIETQYITSLIKSHKNIRRWKLFLVLIPIPFFIFSVLAIELTQIFLWLWAIGMIMFVEDMLGVIGFMAFKLDVKKANELMEKQLLEEATESLEMEMGAIDKYYDEEG